MNDDQGQPLSDTEGTVPAEPHHVLLQESAPDALPLLAVIGPLATATGLVAREAIRQHGETKREELRQNGETTRAALTSKLEPKAIEPPTRE